MSDALIAAGGIAPLRSASGRSDVDVVTARTYAHPALGPRAVIRLVPRTLGQAEDQVGEFLGLARTAEPVEVGTGQQRALGFPGWALVHDPAHGRYALAMVKELERLARLARSKPGNAEAGYHDLASTLDDSVPHFLPTFWEQAGRAYIEAENAKQAAACFGRARDAERIHALPVDEERLAQVHLEFALQGALTAKTLTQYGQELAARNPPAQAHAQFAVVARQRIAGGLPPHAGLAADLRRLAKAAGLDPDPELARFVAGILWMPAVLKAAIGFWTSFQAPLRRLVATDPTIRHRLLSIMPDSGSGFEVAEGWLGLLVAVDAIPALLDPADTSVSAVQWVGRLARHRLGYWRLRRSATVLDLVRRLAPRLRAEAVPIALFDHRDVVELDLLDLCLAEGLTVVPPRRRQRLDVAKWHDDANPGRRDLVAVATDPIYRPMFSHGVRDLVSRNRPGGYGRPPGPVSDGVLAALVEVPGIQQSIVDWLTDRVERTAGATLVSLTDLLGELQPLRSPAALALAPAAAARLVAADPGAALGRTLRTGLIGEYTWPAYETGTAGLTGRLGIDVSWPYLVVCDEARAVVLGPEGIVLEHQFQLPATARGRYGWRVPDASYVDGQLFVSYWLGSGRRAYWTGRPQDQFDVRDPAGQPGRFQLRHRAPTLVLLDRGASTGGRPWRAGDRSAPARLPIATDGTGYWRAEPAGRPPEQTWQWREYDPRTGAAGRLSTPSFLDQPDLNPLDCAVNAAPPEFAPSPLGYAGGLVGWRVRTEPDGGYVGEGIDGRRVAWRPGAAAPGRRLAGALPDDVAGLRPVITAGDTVELWTADGTQAASRVDVGPTCPPIEFWHAMTRRDEAGSAVLRTVTDEAAAELVAAVRAIPADDRPERAAAVVASLLPAVSDRVLRTEIGVVAMQAAACADVLALIRGHLDTTETATAAAGRRPAVFRHGAFSVFQPGLTGEVLDTVLAQIRAAGTALAGDDPDPAAFAEATHEVDWPAALLVLPALLYRAVAPLTDVDERAGIVALLLAVAQTRLVYFEPGGATRMVRGKRAAAADAPVLHPPGTVLRSGPGRSGIVLSYAPVRSWDMDGRLDHVHVIERSADGEFGPIADYTLTEDLRFASGDPEHLASVADRVRTDGPPPWRPEVVDRLAEATSMTRAEAAILLAGLPELLSADSRVLAAPARDLLGLKVNEAKAARRSLAAQPTATLHELLAAAGSAEADRLWRDGPNLDRIATVWRDAHGDPDPEIDLRLVLDLPTVRGSGLPVSQLAAPATHPWLRAAQLRDDERLPALVVAMLWLAYQLPVGHPIRAGLAGAYRKVREVLTDPGFVVDGYGPPTDPGLPALRLVSSSGFRPRYELRTHQVTGPGDPALRVIHRPELRLLLATSVEALMASLADAPGRPLSSVDRTGSERVWPQDPRVSRPDLVAAVADRHRLDPDAAAYYLQLLALPDPTDANVKRWNGWTPEHFQAVRAAVAATPLVLTARRERAGRDLFLPGGWLPQREPNRPLERWKEDFLLVHSDHTPVLGVILVDRPVAQLFGDAWARVLSGGEPRYGTLGGDAG